MISPMTREDEFGGCILGYFYLSVCLRSVKQNRNAFFLSCPPIIFLANTFPSRTEGGFVRGSA